MTKRIIAGLILSVGLMTIPGIGQNKYVGVKMCAICHRSDKQGKQFDIWQKTKHADAYKALLTPKAEEFAKARGLTKPAAESPECLGCHTSAASMDPKLVEKTFDFKDGVQCETCHGPGSKFKDMTTMKNKEKAIAAGMSDFKDAATIEKFCRTCHNEKSPSYKEFKFDEMWGKIKHTIPKAG